MPKIPYDEHLQNQILDLKQFNFGNRNETLQRVTKDVDSPNNTRCRVDQYSRKTKGFSIKRSALSCDKDTNYRIDASYMP